VVTLFGYVRRINAKTNAGDSFWRERVRGRAVHENSGNSDV
jgi:hypothetical protein